MQNMLVTRSMMGVQEEVNRMMRSDQIDKKQFESRNRSDETKPAKFKNVFTFCESLGSKTTEMK